MLKMYAKSNNILIATSLISICHGFWVTSGLFMAMPTLFDLNVFSDTNTQPDTPGIYSIVELVLAGCSFLIGVVGSYGIVASKRRVGSSTSQFLMGSFFTVFTIVQGILLFFRFDKNGYLKEYNINDGTGSCLDASFTGCPTARYKSANYTIETISDCKFNAFDLNNINNQAIGGGSQLVDWSNVFNYDVSNAATLAAAANSGGTLELDAAAMPNIGHCWYWGCDEVCNPRYKLNQMWTIYAMASLVVYLLLTILTFVAGGNIAAEEELASSDESPDVEAAPDKFSMRRRSRWSNSNSSSSNRLINLDFRI